MRNKIACAGSVDERIIEDEKLHIIFEGNDQSQTGYWLNVALENAQSAVLLSDDSSLKKQALFHVQQSAETATKALALGIGMSYEKVKGFGHNNLDLSCKIIDRMMEEIHLKPFLGAIMPESMANESLKAFGALLRETGDSEFRGAMQLASPSHVKEILGLINGVNSNLEHSAPLQIERLIAEVPTLLNFPEENQDARESIIPRGVMEWMERQGKDADALKDLLDLNLKRRFVFPETDHRGERSDSDDANRVSPEVVIKEVQSLLKLVMAAINVFLIGALAWPHQSSARYPVKSDAQVSAEETTHLRTLGTQHYTDEIGVIRYIRELSLSIREAVETLNNYYHGRL